MNTFTSQDTLIIVGIVIAYIVFTTWLTFRLRSKNSGDFMEGSRAMPAFLVGILLMSEYIGAKSTIGTAQARSKAGLPHHGPFSVQPLASRCSGYCWLNVFITPVKSPFLARLLRSMATAPKILSLSS